MANPYEHVLTAVDVGSAKTAALVVEVTDGGLRYRGHGVAESRGSRKGVIVELDKAVAAIQQAVEENMIAFGVGADQPQGTEYPVGRVGKPALLKKLVPADEIYAQLYKCRLQ